jgi:hypothetical protein
MVVAVGNDSSAVLTCRNVLANLLPANPELRVTVFLCEREKHKSRKKTKKQEKQAEEEEEEAKRRKSKKQEEKVARRRSNKKKKASAHNARFIDDINESTLCASYTETFELRKSPHFAAGFVVNGRLADRVAAQCFFNPYVPALIQQLVHHTYEPTQLGGFTNLSQQPIPPQFIGRTVSELLSYLLSSEDALPIALYRYPSPENNAVFPYVFANPPPSTRLCVGDRMFVLRHRSQGAAHPTSVVQLSSL